MARPEKDGGLSSFLRTCCQDATHHPSVLISPARKASNSFCRTFTVVSPLITGASKRFGPKILFEELDWLVTPGERTGLVGANGTGKSTLLKILAGIDSLDGGSKTVMKGVTFGYLPQDGLSLSGRSVFAECMTVFAGLRALEEEQEALAARMAELDPAGAEYAQVSERFHQAESEFRARAGYAVEAQVGTVLSGLGFSREDWKRRTEEFSGRHL